MDIASQNADAVLAAMQGWRFDNRFVRELPGDPVTTNARRQVKGACYSRVDPTPCRAPRLLAWSPDCCRLLDLPDDPSLSQAFADIFAGNRLLPGMEPFAMCYGGHQFGTWAGQLGDGRAINLGEVVNRAGQRHTLQLKGAGPTPYSRTADGLAVLRSSLREFLCSEAMHHLGIPTTRALSLVLTGDQVVRDMFYDGRPQAEPGAIVCRVSQSFVRFGNFEILAARGELENLRRLLAHVMGIAWDPNQPAASGQTANWFAGVCERTSDMIVHWMRVGFVHGVMNTDNMSVLGETTTIPSGLPTRRTPKAAATVLGPSPKSRSGIWFASPTPWCR
jgi:serine/tyrosine/threonine adenylyltransferase